MEKLLRILTLLVCCLAFLCCTSCNNLNPIFGGQKHSNTVKSTPKYPSPKKSSAPQKHAPPAPVPIPVPGAPQKTADGKIVYALVRDTYRVSMFDQVAITGNAEVAIVCGDAAVRVTKLNAPENIVSVRVRHHILTISTPLQPIGKIKIQIASPYAIRGIKVSGSIALQGDENVTAKALELHIDGNNSLSLSGEINLRRLIQNGDGKIDLSWINSKKVIVESTGNGHIYLAGRVKDFLIKLKKTAKLDARYLRAEKITALVTDNTVADVFAIKELNGYADQNSTLYYHNNLPLTMNIVAKDTANVLQGDVLM
jgi:hypothetical protein